MQAPQPRLRRVAGMGAAAANFVFLAVVVAALLATAAAGASEEGPTAVQKRKFETAFAALDRNSDKNIDFAEFQAASEDGTLLALATRLVSAGNSFIVATVNAVSAAAAVELPMLPHRST